MMIKTTLTCALTLAFLTACAPSRNAAPSTATPRATHWTGPAATKACCPAPTARIRTRVTLSDNGRYEKQTQYLDRQPQPEVVAGTSGIRRQHHPPGRLRRQPALLRRRKPADPAIP